MFLFKVRNMAKELARKSCNHFAFLCSFWLFLCFQTFCEGLDFCFDASKEGIHMIDAGRTHNDFCRPKKNFDGLQNQSGIGGLWVYDIVRLYQKHSLHRRRLKSFRVCIGSLKLTNSV